MDQDSRPRPHDRPRRPHGINRLPIEVLLQLASHLPQRALANFLKANPTNRQLSKLKDMTFGSRSFAPWRRRWDMYTRAHNEAQKEADDQAWSAEYSKNEEQQQPQEEPEPIPTAATVILSTQLHRAGNKGDRELHYEDIMRNLFESYGYKPPEQEARCGEAKRVKLAPAPKLFPVLYERLVFLALSRDVPEDKGYLRLRRLGCDAGMLRAELEALTSAPLELVQAMTPGEDHMVGDSSCYKLLTAYLMFSSLRPEQVWRVVELATEVGKRDAERDDCQRALLEFFCFLGLWMELWEAQAGMMRLPQGMALPVSVLQEQSRRVLIASLRECLEVKFAPAKPFMGVETPVEQQFPSQGGAGQAMTGQRSHSINNYRSAVPQRNHSWEMGSDASYGPPSTMPTGYDGNTPVWEPPMSTLTEEQKSIVNTDIGEGELMKVRAYAGTGKTRSLVEFAKQRPLKRFLYVAFNKSAETDAKAKFGHNVDCRTVHALALGVLRYSSPQISAAKAANTMSIPSYWGNKELSDYLKLDEEGVIAKALENPDFHDKPGRRRKKNTVESMGNKLPWPTTTTVATVVKMGLERFWNSIDKEVEEKSLPLSMIEKIGLKKEAVHQWVKGIWKDILEARAPWLPHDAYLKLLFLFGEQSGGDQRAFGGYDIILFDEAQDANPCMATIVMRQQAKKLGIIVVGDPYQRIYGFRGAGNEAFDDIKFKPVKTIYLTWSFRFGDEVADLANIMLRALGELVPVNGARKIDKVRAAVSMEEDFGVGNFAYEENTPPEHPGEPFTVIFRKNITLIEYAISFALEHPNHKLYLRIQRNFQKTTLFNTLREAFSLYHDNIRASTYPLKSWKSWEDLKLHVEAEAEDGGVPDSPILTMVVQLEPRLKDPLFREHLRRIEANVLDDTSRHLADVVLITAHQAKGLEWDRVQVAPDFKPDYSLRNRVSRTKYLKEEACVLYVALTRARKELIVSGPLRGWIAGDRGWERTFLQLMVPGEQGGVGCYFCAIQLDGPGSYPHPHGDEYGYLKCLERVLLRVEETVGCASFSGRMHREFALEQSAVPEEKAAVSTVMCLRCANAVVLARPPELQDLAGVDRILEVLGMYGKGVESVEVGWAERKAWDEAGAAKLETEMVEGWVEGGCWRTWREVREEMA